MARKPRDPNAPPRPSYDPQMSPIAVDEIPALTRQNSKAASLVRDFLASGNEAVEVTGASKSFASSLKRVIKADKSLDAKAFKRGDRTILARGRDAEKSKDNAEAVSE